jgi:hypothetical protein
MSIVLIPYLLMLVLPEPLGELPDSPALKPEVLP